MRDLTTHVLDTSIGRPADGVRVQLYALADDGDRRLIVDTRTNADGRTERPLLPDGTLERGRYEIVFHVAEYFRGRGVTLPDPAFLETVPVRFGIAETERHYHVPLLVAPFGYTTYRGS